MNIALDYDETFTADPEFWLAVVDMGRSKGHNFWIVTGRSEHRLDVVKEAVNGIPIVSCGQQAKADEVQYSQVSIDIWIDDDPFNVCFPLDRKIELDPA